MFGKKEKIPLKSEEYELLIKKMTTLASDLGILDAKIQALDTNFRTLRGKINQIVFNDEVETQQKPQQNTYNPNSIFGIGV
jgi:hypothetical protein